MKQSEFYDLNRKPLLEAEDLIFLKVGKWDEYSDLGWNELISMLLERYGPTIRGQIIECVQRFRGDKKSQRSALRWLLRGLELHHVITKVRYDLEADKYYKNKNCKFEIDAI